MVDARQLKLSKEEISMYMETAALLWLNMEDEWKLFFRCEIKWLVNCKTREGNMQMKRPSVNGSSAERPSTAPYLTLIVKGHDEHQGPG